MPRLWWVWCVCAHGRPEAPSYGTREGQDGLPLGYVIVLYQFCGMTFPVMESCPTASTILLPEVQLIDNLNNAESVTVGTGSTQRIIWPVDKIRQ